MLQGRLVPSSSEPCPILAECWRAHSHCYFVARNCGHCASQDAWVDITAKLVRTTAAFDDDYGVAGVSAVQSRSASALSSAMTRWLRHDRYGLPPTTRPIRAKRRPHDIGPSIGFPGSNANALMLAEVNAGRFNISDYVRWSRREPRKNWGLYPRKGVIQQARGGHRHRSISALNGDR